MCAALCYNEPPTKRNGNASPRTLRRLPECACWACPVRAGEVKLAKGLRLTLWGNSPECSDSPALALLAEAAVTVNEPKDAMDVDITLDRGRIRLANSNAKDVVSIRLRFEDRAYDMELEPGAEVVAVLLRRFSTGVLLRGEAKPRYVMTLYRAKGRLNFTMVGSNTVSAGPPGEAIVDGAGNMSFGDAAKNASWTQYKPNEPAAAALRRLSDRLAEKAPVEKILIAEAGSTNDAVESLAVRSLGAIGAVSPVLDALNMEGEDHAPARRAAIEALRQWVRRSHDQEMLLCDAKNEKGLLIKSYGEHNSDEIMAILKGFSDDDRQQPEIYRDLVNDLRDSKIGVREIAYWQLLHLAAGMKLPEYNAAWEGDRLNKATEEWKKLIDDGQLPPKFAP